MTKELSRPAGHPTRINRIGGGARRVLALHCSLAHGGAWGPMAQAMPDLAITAPDLPGHGESADWDGSGDYHDLSTAVAAAVLSDLAQNGPVDLFGHSLGATIALRLALATPEQIRSLTLFEPVLFCAAADTAQFAAFLDSQEAYGAAARAQDWPLAARLFNRLWGTGDPWDTIPLARRDYLTRRMPLVSSCDAVLFHDSASILAPARLEALSMPVLLAQGAASPAIISAVMDTLGRRLPHAHRHVETGAGHMLPITHASSLAPVLARHLATRP